MITKDDLQCPSDQSQKDAPPIHRCVDYCRRILREFCWANHLPNGLNDMPA